MLVYNGKHKNKCSIKLKRQGANEMVVAEKQCRSEETKVADYERYLNGNDQEVLLNKSKHKLILNFIDCLTDDEMNTAIEKIKYITSCRKTS